MQNMRKGREVKVRKIPQPHIYSETENSEINKMPEDKSEKQKEAEDSNLTWKEHIQKFNRKQQQFQKPGQEEKKQKKRIRRYWKQDTRQDKGKRLEGQIKSKTENKFEKQTKNQQVKNNSWEHLGRGRKCAYLAVFLACMFLIGRGVGYARERVFATSGIVQYSENWGLGFGAAGTQPTGNTSSAELAKYNAHFIGSSEEKKIYLTFDCGYENGNTPAILEALKKHNVHATFFVVGHFLESAPELVKQMIDEGHTVGNHTYHHPDMSSISSMEAFRKEMDDAAALFESVTGQKMSMYYRPPQGKYSTQNLQMAKELGYHTFFWSLAYVDWNVDSQPSHEEAFEKLTGRIHPGAIVLLHNTSKTNGEILDELLTKWEEMGYSFGILEELL